MRNRMEGVQVIMVTPFKENFELDEAGLRKNTRFLLDHGHTWLTPTGSIGEFPSLTPEEHRRAISIVLEETRGREDVIVTPGCGGDSTKYVIELAQWCKDAGCSGVMIPPPTYYPADFESAMAHYMAISDAVDIGIIFYYFPKLHRLELSPAQLTELLRTVPNFIAIKDCTRNIIVMERYMRSVADKVTLIAVPGELMAPFAYMVGARAMLSSVANYAPHLPLEIHAAAVAGDYARACALGRKIAKFYDLLSDIQGLALIKEIMDWKGLAGGPVRLPQVQGVTAKQEGTARSLLEEIDIL